MEANARGRVLNAPVTTTVPATTGSSTYVIGLSSVAAIGGFLFGFDSGVINGAVDALAYAFGTRAATTGFAVASVLLGCALGAFVAGAVADRLGRRPTMLLNAVLFLFSAVATGLAGSAAFFIAARLVGGLAIGAASVLAPMYISEVAPSHMRGRLASLQQMAIVLGTVRRVSEQRRPRQARRWSPGDSLARRTGLALDVLDGGRALDRISSRRADDPRVAALPGRPRQAE
jgi:hypothetical protein